MADSAVFDGFVGEPPRSARRTFGHLGWFRTFGHAGWFRTFGHAGWFNSTRRASDALEASGRRTVDLDRPWNTSVNGHPIVRGPMDWTIRRLTRDRRGRW